MRGALTKVVQHVYPVVAVGGDVNHGDSVIITGSGFGSTLPTFGFAGGADGELETTTIGNTPSFGNNTDGGDVGTAGTFNWTRFGGFATITNDGTRGKCISYTDTGEGESAQEYRLPSAVATSGKFMVKYWARYAVSVPGGAGPQYKFNRVNGSGTSHIEDTDSNMVFTYHLDNGGCMGYCNSFGGSGTDVWYLGTGADRPALGGVWQRVEFKFIAPSSQGTGNGQVYYRASRGTAPSYVSAVANITNHQLQSEVSAYQNADRWQYFMWQNWWGNGYEDAVFAVDDHYVQTGSFACVELWDSLTPGSTTIREMQKPTSWADGSITIKFNKGAFPSGTGYLVVLSDAVSDTVLGSKVITVA